MESRLIQKENSMQIYIAVVAALIIIAFVCFLCAMGISARMKHDEHALRYDMWSGLSESFRKPPTNSAEQEHITKNAVSNNTT